MPQNRPLWEKGPLIWRGGAGALPLADSQKYFLQLRGKRVIYFFAF